MLYFFISLFYFSFQLLGLFVSLHGKTVGRIWCGYNILHGKHSGLDAVILNKESCLDRFILFVRFTIILVQVPVYIAEIAPQSLIGALGSVNQVWRMYCFTFTLHSVHLLHYKMPLNCTCFYGVALYNYWDHAIVFAGTICWLETALDSR